MGATGEPLDPHELLKIKEDADNRQTNAQIKKAEEQTKLWEDQDAILITGAQTEVSKKIQGIPSLLKEAAQRGEVFCLIEVGETSPSTYSFKPENVIAPSPNDVFAKKATEIVLQYCNAHGIDGNCQGYFWKHGHSSCENPSDCPFGSYALRFRVSFENLEKARQQELQNVEEERQKELQRAGKLTDARKKLPAEVRSSVLMGGLFGALIGTVFIALFGGHAFVNEFWIDGIWWGMVIGIILGLWHVVSDYRKISPGARSANLLLGGFLALTAFLILIVLGISILDSSNYTLRPSTVSAEGEGFVGSFNLSDSITTIPETVSWNKNTIHRLWSSAPYIAYARRFDGSLIPYKLPMGYATWAGRAGERGPDQPILLKRLDRPVLVKVWRIK